MKLLFESQAGGGGGPDPRTSQIISQMESAFALRDDAIGRLQQQYGLTDQKLQASAEELFRAKQEINQMKENMEKMALAVKQSKTPQISWPERGSTQTEKERWEREWGERITFLEQEARKASPHPPHRTSPVLTT